MRPDVVPADDGLDLPWCAGVRDHHVHARQRRTARRFDLAGHASRTGAALALAQERENLFDVAHRRDELDLFHGDRVVLVEDGHRAHGEQLGERGARVVGAGALGHVRVREQHLGHGYPARGEGLFVGPHEERLTRRRRGLQLGDLLRA